MLTWSLVLRTLVACLVLFVNTNICLAVNSNERERSAPDTPESGNTLTAAELQWLKSNPGLRLAPEANFPPLSYVGENGLFEGISADYIRLIEQKIKYTFTKEQATNLAVILKNARAGNVDVITSLKETPERSEYLLFTSPYIEIPSVIVVKREIEGELHLKSLKGMKVGVGDGYAIHTYLLNNYSFLDLAPFPDDLLSLQELSFGNIDAAIIDLASASYFIEKFKIVNLRIAGNIDYTYNLSLASRRNLPVLNRILNKGLAQITDKERETIEKKWIKLDQSAAYSKEFIHAVLAVFMGVLLLAVLTFTWNRRLKREIEKRNKAQRALRKSEENFRTLVEQSPISIQIINPDGCTTQVNRAWEKLWGITLDNLEKYNILQDNQLEDLGVMPYLQRAFSGEAVFIPAAEYDVIKTFGEGAKKWVQAHAYPVKDESGDIKKVVLMHEDITERTKAEEEIKKNEVLMRNAQRVGHLGFWDWNILTGDLYWSDETYRIYGFQPQEFVPTFDVFRKIVHPEDFDRVLTSVDAALKKDKPYNIDFRFIFPDGKTGWIHVEGEVSRNKSGDPVRFFGTQIDITESRKKQEQIEESLKEKELLLKEIHHRVKNNMAVISSLLSMQSTYVNDDKHSEMFNESINRIKSMTLIHEKLYRSEDLSKIIFSDYIKDMADSMYMAYGINSKQIKLTKSTERVTLGIDSAIPCGLIVNELLSNALKYAFPDSKKGDIRVSLLIDDANRIDLTVSDNGIGMPKDLDFKNTDTLGLSLVNALVSQLKGKIEMNRGEGTEFHITFQGD